MKHSKDKSKDNIEESLVNKVARRCIHLLHGTNFKAWIQFWQTWANLEAIPFIATSAFFTKDVQEQATQRGSIDWAKFQLGTTGVPSVFKSIPGFFKNNNFWDPSNKTIIWDDRLWLGNSYLFLYIIFRTESYLMVAIQLYKFILTSCADWRAQNYRGLQWKPGTDYRNSITNELFFVFCCRLYHATRQSQYLDGAKAQYKLLFTQADKYINHNKLSIFPDAVGDEQFYTYNQGVALQGLAYLLLYGDNYNEYMSQLVRLTAGMIEYFRNKDQPKLIMKQMKGGKHEDLRTGAIFRSFVFRHLLHVSRLLPPQIMHDYKQRVPFLRTFILDNAQAMCKYQNLTPCYNWQKYNDGIIHDYNAFNMFYVLLTAVEMFGINEVVVNGLMVPSDGNLTVKIGSGIRGLYISTFTFDNHGVYRRGERRLMKEGTTAFKDLLRGEMLISRQNNRNIMEITVLTINNQQIPMVLVHIQGEASLFALIPDQLGQNLINNCVVRIKTQRYRYGLQYNSMANIQGQLTILQKSTLSPLGISIG